MKTVRRLLYGEVVISVVLVTLGFVSLFYFFDFVEELQAVESTGTPATPRRKPFCTWRSCCQATFTSCCRLLC